MVLSSRQQETRMKSQAEKSSTFVELHAPGNCFVIPNP